MSLFRPGPVPEGYRVARPLWPNLNSAELPLPALEPVAPAIPAPAQAPDALNQARLQAAELLQHAAVEAEAAAEAARREGYEVGRQEGLAAGHEELNALRQQVQLEAENLRLQVELERQTLEAERRKVRDGAEEEARAIIARATDEAGRMLAEARAEQQRRLDEAQRALVDLAVAAAVRLVQGQLAIEPEAIVQMVGAGLRRLKETDCTVRVNPEDLPLLDAQRWTLERELGAGLLRLQPDPLMARGSFVVTSPQGQIDARPEAQATRLRTALGAALGDD